MLFNDCLSGELELAPAGPVEDDDLGPRFEATGFDLAFFCVGRLMEGASWKAA